LREKLFGLLVKLCLISLHGNIVIGFAIDLQQFEIKSATKTNLKMNPGTGFDHFICGTFDCNLL
jgi:hypothetical protein